MRNREKRRRSENGAEIMGMVHSPDEVITVM